MTTTNHPTLRGIRCERGFSAVTALAAVVALGGTLVGGSAIAADTDASSNLAPAMEEVRFSEAERILWMQDQLHMVEKPMTLRYEFRKTGTMEEGFSDTVELNITKVKDDGMKAAQVTFFTGERNHFVPPNENTSINPVMGIFLQGDMYEMDRLTPGSWRYFHRQMKHAFAEAAEVTPVTVTFDGREVPAQQVRVTPYVNDPHRGEMEQFADKEYLLTVSESVPGYLYEIRTRVDGEADVSEPLIEERLRLVATETR